MTAAASAARASGLSWMTWTALPSGSASVPKRLPSRSSTSRDPAWRRTRPRGSRHGTDVDVEVDQEAARLGVAARHVVARVEEQVEAVVAEDAVRVHRLVGVGREHRGVPRVQSVDVGGSQHQGARPTVACASPCPPGCGVVPRLSGVQTARRGRTHRRVDPTSPTGGPARHAVGPVETRLRRWRPRARRRRRGPVGRCAGGGVRPGRSRAASGDARPGWPAGWRRRARGAR